MFLLLNNKHVCNSIDFSGTSRNSQTLAEIHGMGYMGAKGPVGHMGPHGPYAPMGASRWQRVAQARAPPDDQNTFSKTVFLKN